MYYSYMYYSYMQGAICWGGMSSGIYISTSAEWMLSLGEDNPVNN